MNKQLCPFKPVQHYTYSMVGKNSDEIEMQPKTIETKFSTCIESCVAYDGTDENNLIICKRMK